MHFFQCPTKNGCVPWPLLQLVLFAAQYILEIVPDRKCRVCTSWHSRHLPKSPLDGHLVAAAVNAVYTPAPVYLCIPGRGPQTRVHVFSVSAAPILEAVPVCVSAEDIECLSVCSIDTPGTLQSPRAVPADRWKTLHL